MDDQEFKKKYQKYKHKIKIWEHSFKKKNGRIPSKLDIHDAPMDIRQSYKLYFKMKSQLLDKTLGDIFDDDGFNILENSNEIDTSMEDDFSGNTPNISGINLESLVKNSESKVFSNIDEIQQKDQDISNITNIDEDHVIKEFVPKETSKQNETAWGQTLTKKVPVKPKKENSPIKSNSTFKPSGSLFKSQSFSKRNPRKSLMRQSSEASQGNFSQTSADSQDVLPDLETILSQKAKEKLESASQSVTLSIPQNLQMSNQISKDIDIGWLNRISEENGVLIKTDSNISGKNNIQKSTFGLSNIDLNKIKKIPETEEISKKIDVSQKVDMIGEIEPDLEIVSNGEDEVVAESDNEEGTYRQAAKRRRILPQKSETHSIVEKENKPNEDEDEILKANTLKLDLSTKPVKKRKRKFSESSTENYISGSDSDFDSKKSQRAKTRKTGPKEGQKKRTQTVKEKKVKAVKPIPVKKPRRIARVKRTVQSEITETEDKPEERILPLDVMDVKVCPRMQLEDLKQIDVIASSYVSKVVDLTTIPKKSSQTGPIENDKSKAARSKLEERIKSGKLNENFVTMNLRKKVFVKGKKTMNFSKYKKGLWKQKKAAALCGPDMDMRGCDGGVLTCFNCGMPGHFAQDCQKKGDKLLPINAELDDISPFPTLEEAQTLAKQKAVLVHSTNLQKLPVAANSKLFEKNESDSDIDNSGNNETDHNIDQEDLLAGIDSDEFDTGFNQEELIEVTKAQLVPEDFLKKAGLLEVAENNANIGPVYDLSEDGCVREPTEEVYEVLKMFGHTSFRKGQEKAVMRILSGQSTLVTLSTGSGKSLCYQLPAYLYRKHRKSITLVISPLVSLMEDQVHGIPNFLRAHCLHTGQTSQKQLTILEMIQRGEIDILLLSPEAVVAGEKSTGFGSILRKLPPIAFACIDEVHCVSQWSHNFRPSYLMICNVLQNSLKVNTILGLTATATLPTRTSIIKHLKIHDGENGIVSDIPLPDNLILSVSKDVRKDDALLNLLRSERFSCCTSIIIYCTRRDECEKVASTLRSMLPQAEQPESTNKKRKRTIYQAEAYHAGLPSSKRQAIQNRFMRNELKIVVATIAFGMGINKPDIRGVIHYNMPKNFESYVQEIGRAGRDGKISHCHLFLDHNKSDQNELRRHIFANSIDRHVIRKLLSKIFIPCSCVKNFKKSEFVSQHQDVIKSKSDNIELGPRNHVCPGHEVGFSVEETVQELDIPSENISTLLCYLELDSRWCLNVLSNAYIMCKVISYGGPKYLKQSAKTCPPLAAAIALKVKNGTFDETSNIIEFSVIDISAAIGWNSGVVKYQLKNLEWITNENGFPKRSPISVTYFDLGFRVKSPGDFTYEECEEALISLHERSVGQEQAQLKQLQYVYKGLSNVCYPSCLACLIVDDTLIEKCNSLKNTIRSYFKNDCKDEIIIQPTLEEQTINEISNNVRSLINMYPENRFTGRAIARIFHGIQSPKYPAVIWSRCKFWRKNMEYDFNSVVNIANKIIVDMR